MVCGAQYKIRYRYTEHGLVYAKGLQLQLGITGLTRKATRSGWPFFVGVVYPRYWVLPAGLRTPLSE